MLKKNSTPNTLSGIALVTILLINSFALASEEELDSETLFLEANQLYNEYKVMEAIAKLEKADKIAPNHPNTIANLASYLLEAKLYKKAAKHYKKLMVLEPNNPNAETFYINTKILLFIENKQCDQAINFINNLVTKKDDNVSLNWNLGTCYQDVENHKEALKHWLQVKKLEPKNMHVQTKIIQAFQGLQEIDKRDVAIATLLKMYQDKSDPKYIEKNLFCREQYNIGTYKVLVFQFFDPTKKNGLFTQPFDVADDNQYFYRYVVTDSSGKEKFWVSLGSYRRTTEFARHVTKSISVSERLYHLDYYDKGSHALYGMFNKKPSYDEIKDEAHDIIVSQLKKRDE